MQVGLTGLVLIALAASAAVSGVEGDELQYVVASARLPTGRQGLVAVYDGQDSIYAVGGDLGGVSSDQVVKYSIDSDSVQVLGPFVARSLGAAVMHGDDIIYFGGRDSGYESGVHRFSTTTGSNSLVNNLPSAVDLVPAAWDDVRQVAYVIGGRNATLSGKDWVLHFNATNNELTNVATLPESRYAAGAVWDPHFRVVHIFGGSVSSGWSDDILHYNPVTNSVSVSATKLPYPKYYPRSVMVGRQVYNFARDGLVIYKPESDEVEQVPIAGWPASVDLASFVYVPKVDRIYVFGGRYGGNYRTEIAYIQLQPLPNPTTTTTTTTTPTTTTTSSTTTAPTTTTTTPSTTTTTTTTPTPTTTTEPPTTTTTASTTTTDAPPTMTTDVPGPGFECPDKETAFYPDPADCASYYVCFSGFPFHFNCNDGLWFNPVWNECDFPENVDCVPIR